MNSGDDELSPPYISTYHHDGPYSSSLSSSASSSCASVFSDAASQSSDDSSVHSGGSSDSEQSDAYCRTSRQSSYQPLDIRDATAPTECWPKTGLASSVPQKRPHPRRTSKLASRKARSPPSLVRQCDRKVSFVDSLVDSSAQIVEAIWPLSSVVCRSEMGAKGVLPLRTFIQETLRRSQTSYSTLQVALYYLILIKPHVPSFDFTMEQPDEGHATRALQCGRRMFLSALILASKYLQDRNYSARAWSKICGLSTHEINQNEMAFLVAVNWRLHITDAVFQRWTDVVLQFTPNQVPAVAVAGALAGAPPTQMLDWRRLILKLDADLGNVEAVVREAAVAATAVVAKRARVCSSCCEVRWGLVGEEEEEEEEEEVAVMSVEVVEGERGGDGGVESV
ncbi:hypothetical protein O988_04579 [Pseudogymnoascus sp. VKM F-3808]|nr:hypothetical protein O988_04579 [Pseudogymnoascus sp. VKM F-3808]